MCNFLRNRGGFTLIETSLVLTVAFLGIVGGFWITTNRMKDSRAIILADQMMTVDGAISTYRTENYAALTAAVPIVAGFANALVPTLAELQTAGYLNAGFANTTVYGSNYVAFLAKTPVGCVAPNCDVESLVTISAPILLPDGTIDTRTLGVVANRIGGNGAISYVAANFEGAAGGWVKANPMGTAGLVAVQGGYNSQGFSEFYRRDGSLPLTATLAMGGNTISGLQANVQGAACVTPGEVSQDAAGALLSCQGGSWQPQGSGFWKDPVNTFAALPVCNGASVGHTRVVRTPSVGVGPRAYTCNGAAWLPLAIDDVGNLNVAGIATAGGSVRAPIFYDSNNLAYYTDPASTSVVNTIIARGGADNAIYATSNNWSAVFLDAGSNANVAPQSVVGSAYVNDVYLRSISKWASQNGVLKQDYCYMVMGDPNTGGWGVCFPGDYVAGISPVGSQVWCCH